MPYVHMLGMVDSADSYTKDGVTTHSLSVSCAGQTFNVRGAVPGGLRRKDDVMLSGLLKITSKGVFWASCSVRRATDAEVAEFGVDDSELTADDDATTDVSAAEE